MRRSHNVKKMMRHQRRPSELLLVSMIDIFTVLVTFLLMTAVFSRTVILELKLPSNNPSSVDLPKDLNLEVIVRPDRCVLCPTPPPATIWMASRSSCRPSSHASLTKPMPQSCSSRIRRTTSWCRSWIEPASPKSMRA
jgi:hypothetical protein